LIPQRFKKYPLNLRVKLSFFKIHCETSILHTVIRIEVTDSGLYAPDYDASDLKIKQKRHHTRRHNFQSLLESGIDAGTMPIGQSG